MKKIMIVMLVSLLLAGCGSSTPPQIIDNGKPGQIKAIVFYDKNKNGIMDQDELGLNDSVSISQQLSCPPSNSEGITKSDTNSNGEAVFTDLKPGRYCVAYVGGKSTTTKLTVEVYLSSEQTAQAFFGLFEK